MLFIPDFVSKMGSPRPRPVDGALNHSSMKPLSAEAFYKSVLAATRLRDRKGIAVLIEGYPHFHDLEGEDGSLVEVLDREGLELLETAFEAGLSPDAGRRDEIVQTFLQKAASSGDTQRLALAIRFGADLERRNEDNETALAYACAWDQMACVRLLVEAGADLNAVERPPDIPVGGFTALDSCQTKPEIADYLRAHGAKRYDELCPQS